MRKVYRPIRHNLTAVNVGWCRVELARVTIGRNSCKPTRANTTRQMLAVMSAVINDSQHDPTLTAGRHSGRSQNFTLQIKQSVYVKNSDSNRVWNRF